MRSVTLPSIVLLAAAGALAAPPARAVPTVRSIQVELISTRLGGPGAIEFRAIQEAWTQQQVGLSVETNLDPAAIERAKIVVRNLYRRDGHAVRVEHRVAALPPNAAEVVIRVIELCE